MSIRSAGGMSSRRALAVGAVGGVILAVAGFAVAYALFGYGPGGTLPLAVAPGSPAPLAPQVAAPANPAPLAPQAATPAHALIVVPERTVGSGISWDIEYDEHGRGFRLRLPAELVPDSMLAEAFDVHAWRDGHGGELLVEFAPAARPRYVGEMAWESAARTSFEVTATEAPPMNEWDLAEAQAQLTPTPTPTPTPTAVVGAPAGEVRTLREPSFTERDRGVSRDGTRLAQRGQLLEAYDRLQSFIDHNPEAHISRETLITLLIAQQDQRRASRLLDEGLALAPHHAGYKKLRARLAIREGAAAEALALMLQAPPPLEADLEYHDLLASLRQQTGDHEGAIAAYQRLLARVPGHARWWAAMAISLEALGRGRDAITSYQQALQSPDLDPEVRQYSQRRIALLEQR